MKYLQKIVLLLLFIQNYAFGSPSLNHPTAFTATANSTSQITTSWTDSVEGQTPDGYLVMCSTSNSFTDPNHGYTPSDDTSCADGAGVQNIAHGTGSTVDWAELSGGTEYFYKIFPYIVGSHGSYYTVDGLVTTNSECDN